MIRDPCAEVVSFKELVVMKKRCIFLAESPAFYLWCALVFMTCSSAALASDRAVDLSGFYDSGTLTPVSRPQEFGDKQFMTREEANKVTENMRSLIATSNSKSDPDRSAPKLGGDGNNGLGAGGVGLDIKPPIYPPNKVGLSVVAVVSS